jgi:hypothetical protein
VSWRFGRDVKRDAHSGRICTSMRCDVDNGIYFVRLEGVRNWFLRQEQG